MPIYWLSLKTTWTFRVILQLICVSILQYKHWLGCEEVEIIYRAHVPSALMSSLDASYLSRKLWSLPCSYYFICRMSSAVTHLADYDRKPLLHGDHLELDSI